MATPPDAPPTSPDNKPQNIESQVLQPTNVGHQDAKGKAEKESSPTSVFVNSEPIREEQVRNAVNFLSHPKVKGSPVMYRRSFLERKGLTKEEIDEAFRRVPDPASAVTSTQAVVSNPDGQIKSSSNVQQQPPTQMLQPTAIAPMGSTSRMGTLSHFHWYHAILAVGFLAASGAGTTVLLKKSIVPRLKSWIRKVVSEEDEEGRMKKIDAKPSPAEEAAAAAKAAAAAAAADVARASHDMLITKNEEKRCFEELINVLNVQVHEMKSMSSAIQKLESGQSINGRISLGEDNVNEKWTSTGQPYTNGKIDHLRPARPLSAPTPVEPSMAPHPKSYMEIMEMLHRGERPSNIREINDAPPDPNQPFSNPRIAPKPKPWEISQPQESTNGSNYNIPDIQLNEDGELPWFQQKNVRITEIESGEEQKFGYPSVSNRPAQKPWVPPLPPPIAMPEAAEAIRQPKKAAQQTEELTDDQLLSRSADAADELQRVTKIAENGGSMEASGEISGPSSTEVTKEIL